MDFAREWQPSVRTAVSVNEEDRPDGRDLFWRHYDSVDSREQQGAGSNEFWWMHNLAVLTLPLLLLFSLS